MSKYYATFAFDATKSVVIESNSLEECTEQMYDSGGDTPSLCHYCSSAIDLGDCIGVTIHDENEDEVYCDIHHWEMLVKANNQIKQLRSQIDFMLTKVGFDDNGAFLAAGNSQLDVEKSKLSIIKLMEIIK